MKGETMKHILIGCLLSIAGFVANAEQLTEREAQSVIQSINWNQFWSAQEVRGLNWKVGDLAEFDLKLAVIPGTMLMFVADIQGSIAVLNQELSIGPVTQGCDMYLNLNTGELVKTVCAGQEQKPESTNDTEVVEIKEETITVPAGKFATVYIKAVTGPKKQVVEQWINRKDIPILGLVQSVTPSPIGSMTLKLKAFKKM